uniref:Tetraspanin n=1 Tax=Gadus morhua TaxID=8049 RepID=A0A8C5BMW3_GADMO
MLFCYLCFNVPNEVSPSRRPSRPGEGVGGPVPPAHSRQTLGFRALRRALRGGGVSRGGGAEEQAGGRNAQTNPSINGGQRRLLGLFWAAGLAVFTLGVWARLSLADYMLLSSNRYPNAPLVLLAAGAAVTAWGFLGCLGVAAGLPGVLRAYGFFQLLTLAAGLAAGLCGLFYRQDIAGGFRSGLQRAVARYGEDAGRADALDSLQRALDCCGADGWQDCCCARRMGCRNRLLPPEREGGIHPHGCFRKVFSVVNDNVFHIAASVLGLAFTQAGETMVLSNQLNIIGAFITEA